MKAYLVLTAVLFLGGCASHAAHGSATHADPVDEISPQALFRRGLSLVQRGDPVRGEQYLQAARQRGVPARRVVPRLVEACLAGNRIRSALAHVLPYLRTHPRDWAMRHLAAALELALKHPHQARHHLEEVVSHVVHPPSHYLLGVVLDERLGEPDAARSHFRRYLKLAPQGRFAAAAHSRLQRHATVRLGESRALPEHTTNDESAARHPGGTP